MMMLACYAFGRPMSSSSSIYLPIPKGSKTIFFAGSHHINAIRDEEGRVALGNFQHMRKGNLDLCIDGGGKGGW
jgi:hypothetical protein